MIIIFFISVEICANGLDSQNNLNLNGAKFFHTNLNTDHTDITEHHNKFDSMSFKSSSSGVITKDTIIQSHKITRKIMIEILNK